MVKGSDNKLCTNLYKKEIKRRRWQSVLLQELYNNNMISFAEKCDDWKEAIFESIEPLVQQKIIDSKYGQEIFESR